MLNLYTIISELKKINVFFAEKLAEATRKLTALKGELFSDPVIIFYE
jgi:hypothetical protein